MPRIEITSNTAIKGKPVAIGDIVDVDVTDVRLLCDEYKSAVRIKQKPSTPVDNEGDGIEQEKPENLKKRKGKKS